MKVAQPGPQRVHHPRTVKIYRERNTGTSYLEELLMRNLSVDSLRGGVPRSIRRLFPDSEYARDWYFRATSRRNLGWKHALVPSAKQLAMARPDSTHRLFLTLTKNPYAWLLSLYRQPYHAKPRYSSLEQFLSEPWETVGREAMKGRDRGKTFDDYRAYYLNERWRTELDDHCIPLINEPLDPDVMSYFRNPKIEADNERLLARLAHTTHD